VRILIAEDETLIRLDLRSVLESGGFDVCAEAKDGNEAVEPARALEPDLAILDVKMPELDGIEAARRIIAERPIPIVILSAYGEDEPRQAGRRGGGVRISDEAFREGDLAPAIRTACARHQELGALREETESLAEALAARKAIERAKGLLMAKEGLSEDEAYDSAPYGEPGIRASDGPDRGSGRSGSGLN
jgi:AmiR/NasT family two-component response regulator